MADIVKTRAFAFDQHTISSAALALADLDFTQDQVDETARVVISVRSGEVNIAYDGTTPTTSLGHIFTAGDIFEILGNNDVQNLQLIRNGAVDAVVDVTLEM